MRTLLLVCCLLLALPGQAQRVETRLFKKWIVEDEDGSKRLFDMSDKKTWIMAATYTPEDCKMMGEAFKLRLIPPAPSSARWKTAPG